jgi:hypothetical protein
MASRKGAQLHHSATQAVQSDQGRRHGRAAGRKTRSPWPWIALAVVVLISGALVLFLSGTSRATGRLSAAQQMHDFGQVSIHGGLISTRFPLTVEGETLVIELSSS